MADKHYFLYDDEHGFHLDESLNEQDVYRYQPPKKPLFVTPSPPTSEQKRLIREIFPDYGSPVHRTALSGDNRRSPSRTPKTMPNLVKAVAQSPIPAPSVCSGNGLMSGNKRSLIDRSVNQDIAPNLDEAFRSGKRPRRRPRLSPYSESAQVTIIPEEEEQYLRMNSASRERLDLNSEDIKFEPRSVLFAKPWAELPQVTEENGNDNHGAFGNDIRNGANGNSAPIDNGINSNAKAVADGGIGEDADVRSGSGNEVANGTGTQYPEAPDDVGKFIVVMSGPDPDDLPEPVNFEDDDLVSIAIFILGRTNFMSQFTVPEIVTHAEAIRKVAKRVARRIWRAGRRVMFMPPPDHGLCFWTPFPINHFTDDTGPQPTAVQLNLAQAVLESVQLEPMLLNHDTASLSTQDVHRIIGLVYRLNYDDGNKKE